VSVVDVFCHVPQLLSASLASLQNLADKKRLNIIIVAEGAIDSHNKAITPDYIKDVSTVTDPQKHAPPPHCCYVDFSHSYSVIFD